MPNDGSLAALVLWALAIGAVAWCWDTLENRWLEWRHARKTRKIERAWAQWYASRPCKSSQFEPWRSPAERPRTKAGRL